MKDKFSSVLITLTILTGQVQAAEYTPMVTLIRNATLISTVNSICGYADTAEAIVGLAYPALYAYGMDTVLTKPMLIKLSSEVARDFNSQGVYDCSSKDDYIEAHVLPPYANEKLSAPTRQTPSPG